MGSSHPEVFCKIGFMYFNSKINASKYRSSRLEVFCRKGVLRNFGNFTGKHLCRGLLYNKVAGLRTVTLLKKRFWYRCFPVNFSKFLKTPFITENLWWLLLKTPVNQLIFREELVDLQLYYSRTCSQEVFKHLCFKHFKVRKYYYGRTSANENVRK